MRVAVSTASHTVTALPRKKGTAGVDQLINDQRVHVAHVDTDLVFSMRSILHPDPLIQPNRVKTRLQGIPSSSLYSARRPAYHAHRRSI